MSLCKTFLLFALIPLVICVAKKVEENDELLESVPELRAENSPNISSHVLARTLAILWKTRATLATMEARLRRLEAHRLYQLRGRDGRDGLPGKPGKDGRDGRNGAQGIRGPSGLRGIHGRNGARGPRGPSGGGVKYVRWGKTSCPAGASLVYKGRIGGEHYTHTGGGANYVCLTEKPKYSKYKNGFQSGGRMFGTEYEVSDNTHLFTRNLHDHEAPCAVCYVRPRSTELMIPGTYACPAGWRREYWGYLMTTHYAQPHPSEFICVDRTAEAAVGSHVNHNGALLYAVQGVCGSLPCNPYKNGRELICAVCTK